MLVISSQKPFYFFKQNNSNLLNEAHFNTLKSHYNKTKQFLFLCNVILCLDLFLMIVFRAALFTLMNTLSLYAISLFIIYIWLTVREEVDVVTVYVIQRGLFLSYIICIFLVCNFVYFDIYELGRLLDAFLEDETFAYTMKVVITLFFQYMNVFVPILILIYLTKIKKCIVLLDKSGYKYQIAPSA